MKIPFSWLKEFLPTSLSAEECAHKLTEIGLEVDALSPSGADWILDISLTPNLAHCASVYGVARELGSVLQLSLTPPAYSPVTPTAPSLHDRFALQIEHPACFRYATRLITGARVGPSPKEAQHRLAQCGLRPTHAVLDALLLVQLGWGQPLQAYDATAFSEGKIQIRKSLAGETLRTCDGISRSLPSEALVIADPLRPLGLAGILGGEESRVTEMTTDILLEAALFDPRTIRRVGKQLDLHTEDSYRFERGVDPAGWEEALERAISLICQWTGGTLAHGCLTAHTRSFPPRTIRCRLARLNTILGTTLAMSEVETALRAFHHKVVAVSAETVDVTVPSYRYDLHQEIDLIEEVARFYGYDLIRRPQKAPFRLGTLPHSPLYLFEKEVRTLLLREGLQEIVTCDLISASEAALVGSASYPSRTCLTLLNPRSEEHAVLRPSLLPGMLRVARTNTDHETSNLALFEIGRVHFTHKETYCEPTLCALLLTGNLSLPLWDEQKRLLDFFDAKGILENLLEGLNLSSLSFTPSAHPHFHPHRQASLCLGEHILGLVGELHPRLCRDFSLPHPVVFAEWVLEDLRPHAHPLQKAHPLPLFPSSSRDWTVTLPAAFPVGQIYAHLHHLQEPWLESFSVQAVFQSPALGPDKKNVTFRFVYRDPEGTLSFEAVEQTHKRILTHLETLS